METHHKVVEHETWTPIFTRRYSHRRNSSWRAMSTKNGTSGSDSGISSKWPQGCRRSTTRMVLRCARHYSSAPLDVMLWKFSTLSTLTRTNGKTRQASSTNSIPDEEVSEEVRVWLRRMPAGNRSLDDRGPNHRR